MIDLDLDQRLRRLARTLDPGEPTPTATLHARAARRRTRRRLTGAGAAVVLVAVAAVSLRLAIDDGERHEVVAGPSSTVEVPPVTTSGQRSIGEVDGITLEVAPSAGLVDGQLVTVRIDGLSAMPGAVLVMCRGDVVQSTAVRLCDPGAIAGGGFAEAEASQEVRISRYLQVPGDPLTDAQVVVDCATDPAGCVLGFGNPYASPVRGVVAPVVFAPAEPLGVPDVRVSPATGVDDGQAVAVAIDGLRPHRDYRLVQCAADGRSCGGVGSGPGPLLRTGADGSLRGQVAVSSVLYGSAGRVDCTSRSCVIGVLEPLLAGDATFPNGLVGIPIAFAPGTAAPVPRLTIDPRGPYAEGQEVVVSGTGFPAGIDVGRDLGICPSHLDPALEERCAYPLAFSSVPVQADGTFETPVVLGSTTAIGPCRELPAGCVLAWVLNHGPMATSTPLIYD